ncbi:preprotein translocase subunit YajC [Sinomonas sp. ASV322]|uniref:preprotein translocase subunit YajC n=1 Tax=Sinomonas sp. ASV322 TaxID=3041920 RepID=UPI0027DC8545|nr:preprotein translocase subunit YajC [Sinomonas sp. ASV322]MDQ4501159.1 preprotein translocase subunit YajC [Sinomonas sp. ASV322]
MPFDPITILLLVVFAFFIFTMFRRNRKTQSQQAEMRSKFVPGVEVMTSFGLFGRIVSVDESENKVVLELSPGATATVHKQAISKVVEPSAAPAVDEQAADDDDAAAEAQSHTPSGDPAPHTEARPGETPEETLKRLNGEGK